jgi:hypothetical protein
VATAVKTIRLRFLFPVPIGQVEYRLTGKAGGPAITHVYVGYSSTRKEFKFEN